MTTRSRLTPSLADLEEEVRAELGRARTLSDIVLGAPGFAELAAGQSRTGVRVSAPLAAVTAGVSSNPSRVSVARPVVAATPLLDAITVVPDVLGAIHPMDVSFTSAADVVAEGAPSAEATLAYTAGDITNLDTISHHITVNKRDLKYSRNLRADIDVFLAGGVLVRLEQLVGAALAAKAGMVAHAWDTDLATTLRTAVARAQTAMRELGPGVVTVALSPNEHAALDLAVGADLTRWPCRIVSAPAIPDGAAYVGRLALSTFLYTSDTSVSVALGNINAQFVENKATLRANLEGLAHIAAPASIVKADLTGDDES